MSQFQHFFTGGGQSFNQSFTFRKTPPEIMIKMIESGRLPKPGEGPPPSLRKICRFQATLIAVNENGDDVCCTVTGGE